MTLPVLTLRGIRKSFGAVAALMDVDLDVYPGEVHALLGENGAGKSTLMKVIYGLVQADAGEVQVGDVPQRFASALDAQRVGIGMVHQEFALVDALSVIENLALCVSPPGSVRFRPQQAAAAARQLAAQIGLELGDLDARVGTLPVGMRQRIEIVKALAGATRVLILDEPTAVLTPAEVEQLFAVLTRLRAAGTAVLFITHKLAEVSALADRVTVMRRGRIVARAARGAFTEAELSNAMVGPLEPTPAPATAPTADGRPRLSVERLSIGGRRGVVGLREISFAVRAGELFGVAGVDGNGQDELFEVLTGLRRPARGRVLIDGTAVDRFEPAALLAAGLACVPPDRQRLGIAAGMSVADNAVLNARLLRGLGRHGLLHPAAQRTAAQAMVERYAIKAGGLDAPASSLSGGNQQKLIVARALALAPRVLVAANPTRGLDIAAAQAVYAAIDAALASGAAALLISTDLDEIVARCHRVAVLFRGELSQPLERPFAAEQLGALLAGRVEAA